MQEHFCRLQPSLGHVPLSARYSTYRFQGNLPVSPTMSTFIDLRRHRPHRQLSSSPRFVIRSPLCCTTTHIAPPPTHPPSSSIRLPSDPSTPPSPSISPVDARPSFFAFVSDDHWCDHTLRHSASPPPFLRQR